MDVFNLNSIINYSIQNTILIIKNGVSVSISKDILYLADITLSYLFVY